MSSIPARKGIAAHVSLPAVFWNRIVIRKGCNGKLCDEGTQLQYFRIFCVGNEDCRNLEDRSHATYFDNSSKNVLFTLFFVDDCLLYRMKSNKSVWGAGGIAYHNGIITGRELVV